MKEIKFRAWDKWKKEIIQPNNGDFIGWHAMTNWRDCLEVMQYTGLKDKNGKEIYEGDRVRVLYSDWPSGDYTKMSVDEYKKSISQYGVVIFDNRFGCAEYVVDYEDYKDNIYVGPHGEIEIIGNIYENGVL